MTNMGLIFHEAPIGVKSHNQDFFVSIQSHTFLRKNEAKPFTIPISLAQSHVRQFVLTYQIIKTNGLTSNYGHQEVQ